MIFMKRALELAKKGMYKVAPNPMVGAVVVYNGKIIGEGFHQEYGKAHAEVNAINAVKDEALLAESSIYVNLEPCSHHGKTPPCADLIIEKKIKEVVIANIDPSEKVGGKGIQRLIDHGIEVRTGVLEKEGKELNKRFLSLHGKLRPYITLKWAVTKDGFIGRDQNDPDKSDSWITNALSKQLVHQWRAEEMGILVGKNTALMDDPELTCREFEGRNPIRFLIDPQLEVPTTAKIFNEQAKTVVLNRNKEESGAIDYVRFASDPNDALFDYCLKNNIHSLLVEGGADTLQRFIDQGLWDEARVFVGEKEFKKGIQGPDLELEPISKENIRGDQLFYFKNPMI